MVDLKPRNSPKKTEGKLLDIGLGNDFLDMTTKAKIIKWNYSKLKGFGTAKETVNKKATYGIRENICKSYI